MLKPTFEEVENLIEQLPVKDKIRLVKKLEQRAWVKRLDPSEKDWDRVLRDIDRRLKRFPISQKEVDQEIESYRKEKRQRKHA